MIKIYFLTACLQVIFYSSLLAQENSHELDNITLKRHKIGLFLGNTLIHEVRNTQTGKEQYVLAPTFGIDYEYWISHKWAIGTYNELAFLNIEVEKNEEEYIKRENVLLFSGVIVFEPFERFSIFAGTGIETDPNETFWIGYFGVEYAFIKSDGWEVAISTGYINKEIYDGFTFGVVIGRRFGKDIPSKHH